MGEIPYGFESHLAHNMMLFDPINWSFIVAEMCAHWFALAFRIQAGDVERLNEAGI